MRDLYGNSAPLGSYNHYGVPGHLGGLHENIICDHSGLRELHSTFTGPGGFSLHETQFGQTRLTDYFNPNTGQILR